jgi:hypothetical protein
MSINNQIDKLIEKNKRLKAVNMTHYDNPFLLLSETVALNELVTNTLPSSRAEVGGIEPNDSHILGSGLTIYESSSNDVENLARHVMNEVYQSPENRREIAGYTMLNSFGDDRNLVYKSNKSNTILYGIRGTEPTSGTDWMTDLEIASMASRKVLPEARLMPTGNMTDRFNNANNIYSKLRDLYPKSKIIIGGHSLGNSVGLDVLYKHQSDNNIDLYSYNGFTHPIYTGKKDPRNHPQRTEGDIVSWWNSDKAKSFKTPMAKGAALTGAAIIGGIVAHKYRQNILRQGAEMAGRQEPIPDDYMINWASVYDNAPPERQPAILNDLDDYLAEDGAVIPDVGATAGIVENSIAVNFPELTDYTEELREMGYIPDGYKYKVYLTDGVKGLDDIFFENPTAEEFASQLNPSTASGIINQTRVTTSEILARQMYPANFSSPDDFDDPDDYPSDDGEEKEDEGEADAREEAEQRAEYEAEVAEGDRIENVGEAIVDIQGEEITTATAIRMALLGEFGATLGLGLLVAYGFYSHLSGNFKPEKNRFISKKKP